MELNELKNDLCLRREVEILNNSIREYIELILDLTESDQIDFYRYNISFSLDLVNR